jgi:hypothetical protein
MFLLTLLACQEPFGTDRHRLEGFRIAAVDAAVHEDGVHPSAVVVHQGRVWTEKPLRFSWYRVPDTDAAAALTPIDPPDAEGPAPVFPIDTALIALLVTDADGEVRRAVLAPNANSEGISALRIEGLPSLNASGVTAEALGLDARRALTPAASSAAAGDFVRITLDTTPTASVRWMATAGTFFELESAAADWAPARIVVDDEVVSVSEPVEDELVSFIAVAVPSDADSRTTPAMRLFDLAIGDVGNGFWNDRHRWIPTEASVPADADWIRATFRADDSSAFGLRLTESIAVDPPPPDDPPNTALPCAVAVSGPFDPDWLARGLCTRDALVGSDVMVKP